MSIKNLFHADYWFSQPFTAQGSSLWLLIGGFLLLIVVGLVCKILFLYQNEKFKKVVLKRSGNLAMTMGFLGMMWMFFRQEGIAFLAWRFWLLLGVVAFICWAASILQYMRKRVPDIKLEDERRARIEKYLPKSNK